MNFSAVILAGGKSSRMGHDKAFLEMNGKTLLARQIALARDTGAQEIFISGRADTQYAMFDCPVLTDKFPNAGPLAGIERALDSIMTPHLLVLAVDLPGLRAGFLSQLLAKCEGHAGAIPRLGGQVEPLAAIYPKAAGPLAEVRLADGNKAVAAFAQQCVHSGFAQFVDFAASEAGYFVNLNSPSDIPAAS